MARLCSNHVRHHSVHHLLRPAENLLIAPIHSLSVEYSSYASAVRTDFFDYVLRRSHSIRTRNYTGSCNCLLPILVFSSFRIDVSPLYALALDTNRYIPHYTKILVGLIFHQTLIRNRY
jgi:hypothetical protein